jgi:hypothetical protein
MKEQPMPATQPTVQEQLEAAWVLIANAGGGNWETQTPEWREAAAKWRDERSTNLAVNDVILANQISSRRLTDGELNALEYYSLHQHGQRAPGAATYALRAIRELRAIRRAGVLVNPDPDPDPTVDHLPLCAASTSMSSDYEGPCVEGCPVLALHDARSVKEKIENCPQTGQWVASTDEENFNGHEGYDTEAEAIEYGKLLCEENGVEDGQLYWTGIVSRLTAEEMAEGIYGSNLIEAIELHLYDNYGGDHTEDGIGASADDEKDLEHRVRHTVIQWAHERETVPVWYGLEMMKSHVFHLCEEVDSSMADPNNHPRCVRYKGHDGGHEYL